MFKKTKKALFREYSSAWLCFVIRFSSAFTTLNSFKKGINLCQNTWTWARGPKWLMNLVAVGGPPHSCPLHNLLGGSHRPQPCTDSTITHHNRNFLPSEDAIGKSFYIEQFWHLSMTNFTNFTPKKEVFSPPRQDVCRLFCIIYLFPFPVNSQVVGFPFCSKQSLAMERCTWSCIDPSYKGDTCPQSPAVWLRCPASTLWTCVACLFRHRKDWISFSQWQMEMTTWCSWHRPSIWILLWVHSTCRRTYKDHLLQLSCASFKILAVTSFTAPVRKESLSLFNSLFPWTRLTPHSWLFVAT